MSSDYLEFFNNIRDILYNISIKHWYDKEWIIVLLSTFFGILATLFVQLVFEIYKKKILKKQMAKSLFLEVYKNKISSKKSLKCASEILISFREIIKNQTFTSHPSLNYTGVEISNDFFNIYKKDIVIFEQYHSAMIYLFYGHYLKCIKFRAKQIDEKFEKFYNHNVRVSSQDIEDSLTEHIENLNTVIKSANDICGWLAITESKILNDRDYKAVETTKREYNKLIKTLRKYLLKLKLGDKVNIDKLKIDFKIEEIVIVMELLKCKKFKVKASSEYEKIK